MPKPRTSLSVLRFITVVSADIFLLSCTTTALILPYVPIHYDVWGLASYYSLYLQISTMCVIAGLWGCWRKQPKLTNFLAKYMIFDLFMSALPRFLLILTMFKEDEEKPGIVKNSNDLPMILTSVIAIPSGIPLFDAILSEVVVKLTIVYRAYTIDMSETEYLIFATILKVGFVIILGLCSALQVAAARCIRQYTLRLERLRDDALSPMGHARRLSVPSQMSDSDLEEWEEYRDTVEEKVA